jgi:hypothetical protein
VTLDFKTYICPNLNNQRGKAKEIYSKYFCPKALVLIKLIIDDDKKQEDSIIDAYEMVALLLRRVMKLESEVSQLKEGFGSQDRRPKKANNVSVH